MQRGAKTRSLAVILGLASCIWGQGYGASGQDQGTLQPQAVGYVGVYRLRQAEPALTGQGVSIGVLARSRTYIGNRPQNDYMPSRLHRCFAQAYLSTHDDGRSPAGVCDHSTAVCSILAGWDQQAFMRDLGSFSYQGVAPRSRIQVYELCHFLAGPLLQGTVEGLDVVTISSGLDFEQWWTRGLEALAQQQGILVVGSIGNGSDALHPPLYPGASPNVLGVGMVDPVATEDVAVATSRFWLVRPEHSSCGPTVDGRCKPDLVAPGTLIVASSGDNGGYEVAASGSSFASPIVAGIGALLIQKARQEGRLADALLPETSSCLFKAILMNSATKLPYWHKGRTTMEDDHRVPLDYAQGAGLLDAVGAYEQLVAGRYRPGLVGPTGWDVSRIDRADSAVQVYQMDLAEPAGQVMTATLAWNLQYGSDYPFERLEDRTADLRLEVWGIDPADPQKDTLLDYCDSQVDNIEHIYLRAQARFTRYQLVVTWGRRSSAQTDQAYAIAWRVTPDLPQPGPTWEDLNGDGLADQRDYARLVQNWVTALTSPGKYTIGDINADGHIDDQDVRILKGRLGL